MSQMTYKQITINPNDVVNPAYNFSEIDTAKVAQAVTSLMSAATNLSTVDTLAANMISSLSNTLARAAGLDHQIFQQMNDREVSSWFLCVRNKFTIWTFKLYTLKLPDDKYACFSTGSI